MADVAPTPTSSASSSAQQSQGGSSGGGSSAGGGASSAQPAWSRESVISDIHGIFPDPVAPESKDYEGQDIPGLQTHLRQQQQAQRAYEKQVAFKRDLTDMYSKPYSDGDLTFDWDADSWGKNKGKLSETIKRIQAGGLNPRDLFALSHGDTLRSHARLGAGGQQVRPAAAGAPDVQVEGGPQGQAQKPAAPRMSEADIPGWDDLISGRFKMPEAR